MCGMTLHELDQMSRMRSFITFDAHDPGVEHSVFNMEFNNFFATNVILEDFINNLSDATNFNRTANGALAHKSTRSYVYDMFAFGGAYRTRTDEDCILLFKNAYEENPELARRKAQPSGQELPW